MSVLNKISMMLLIVGVIAGCTKTLIGEEPANTPVDTFESFWHGIDETWPEFESKHPNWDSVYKVYRPQVTPSTPPSELQRIFKAMLPVLKDGHTNVYPNLNTTLGYFPGFPRNYFGFSWIRTHYFLNTRGNNSMVYSKLGTDIVYIYVANFSGSTSDYTIIDNILNDFGTVKGIIIDVRNNGGGNTRNSQTIASRFADKEHLYEYVRFRVSAKSKALGDFIGYSLPPAGAQQFKGKVAVLTNRYSYSATEDFILMMRAFPNVTLIGDNTGGGSGSRPILKELPNGWTYRVSTSLVSGTDKVPIANGIVPDIKMTITKSDSVRGVDPIIEMAKSVVLK